MNESAAKRVLPHSDAAEKTVIGSLLFNGQSFQIVRALITSSDFYDPKHEAIFVAMSEVDKQQKRIDLITVAEELRRTGAIAKLHHVGNEVFLAELANEIASVENIDQHAQIVRDKSILRKVILEAERIKQLAYSDALPVVEIVDRAQSSIIGIADLTTSKHELKSYKKVLNTTLQALKKRSQRKQAITGVPSGIDGLDELTGGFQPGNSVIIAGRPASGKSSFVQGIAEHAASKGHPVLMFSLEMIDEEIGQRALSHEARIDGGKLKSGMLESTDWMRLVKAVESMANLPILVDDESEQDILTCMAIARKWRNNKSLFPDGEDVLGLVVLDYVQLVKASMQKDRHLQVSDISKGIKRMSKELRCPVLALSALNRECEKRPDKRPMISDLAESGSLEADANQIIFVYRHAMYFKYDPLKDDRDFTNIAELILAKNRGGPTGTVETAFIKEQTKFANLSHRNY